MKTESEQSNSPLEKSLPIEAIVTLVTQKDPSSKPDKVTKNVELGISDVKAIPWPLIALLLFSAFALQYGPSQINCPK